ncbi:MAG: hypothetical protein M0R17_13275 [Candidatus Omnitrophica bacterium]|jgi:hypothetical protein|nr:hypothetical protein [Candidatus Omnitrophota bacterium]
MKQLYDYIDEHFDVYIKHNYNNEYIFWQICKDLNKGWTPNFNTDDIGYIIHYNDNDESIIEKPNINKVHLNTSLQLLKDEETAKLALQICNEKFLSTFIKKQSQKQLNHYITSYIGHSVDLKFIKFGDVIEILAIIAKDLNDGWYPNTKTDDYGYFIYCNKLDEFNSFLFFNGCQIESCNVYRFIGLKLCFKNKMLCDKAIEICGKEFLLKIFK